MTTFELDYPTRPVRIAIAAARFNRFITDQLLEGALDAFRRHGIDPDRITVAWVPGAFELPLAADRLLVEGGFDAVLTPHFDYVAGECSRGVMDVSLRHGKPVLFGVLTTDTVEQALERAAPEAGNKGFDVAVATLNMLHLAEAVRDHD